MNALPVPIGPHSIQSLAASLPLPPNASVAEGKPLSLHNLIGGMARWFAHGSVNAVLPMQRTSLRQVQVPRQDGVKIDSLRKENLRKDVSRKVRMTEITPKSVATYDLNTRLSRPFSANIVRVLHVREPGQARSCVGRMVMSGRMVDVCAELDRLVAREAALH